MLDTNVDLFVVKEFIFYFIFSRWVLVLVPRILENISSAFLVFGNLCRVGH